MYFSKNFDGHGSVYEQQARSQNYFNEILKNSNSRKIRPAKYKRHTVPTIVIYLKTHLATIIESVDSMCRDGTNMPIGLNM